MKNFSKKIIKKFLYVFIAFICIVNLIFVEADDINNMPTKIKAVTYFGDEWPTTFWSREHTNDGKIFERIKNDGFNTLIFCIPWREVQPEFYGDYNNVVIKWINYLVSLANEKGLMVMVRLGYTWDYYENESSFNRYREMWTNDSVKNAWYNYADKMYKELSTHENFIGGFITWEDFWDGLCYNYSNYDDMDNALIDLLINTQKKFNNLSMECRMHIDNTGSRTYSHEKTFSCGNASFSSLLLTNSMNLPNYSIVSASSAIANNEYLLKKFSICNKPIFVDQFLYTESTPGYEFLSKVDNINEYLKGMGNVFKNMTIGYGLWTYQDYVDNVIYNSEFALDKRNWIFMGDSSIVYDTYNSAAYIGDGGEIKQDISWKGFLNKGDLTFNMLVKAEEETDVEISIANLYKTYHLNKGIQNISLNFKNEDISEVSIKSHGKVMVDNIKLYSHVIIGDIYKIDGTEGKYLSGIRALNKNMSN